MKEQATTEPRDPSSDAQLDADSVNQSNGKLQRTNSKTTPASEDNDKDRQAVVCVSKVDNTGSETRRSLDEIQAIRSQKENCADSSQNSAIRGWWKIPVSIMAILSTLDFITDVLVAIEFARFEKWGPFVITTTFILIPAVFVASYEIKEFNTPMSRLLGFFFSLVSLGIPYAAVRALREPADNVFGNKLAQLRAVRLIELMFESIPQSFFQSFIGIADEILTPAGAKDPLELVLRASILISLIQSVAFFVTFELATKAWRRLRTLPKIFSVVTLFLFRLGEVGARVWTLAIFTAAHGVWVLAIFIPECILSYSVFFCNGYRLRSRAKTPARTLERRYTTSTNGNSAKQSFKKRNNPRSSSFTNLSEYDTVVTKDSAQHPSNSLIGFSPEGSQKMEQKGSGKNLIPGSFKNGDSIGPDNIVSFELTSHRSTQSLDDRNSMLNDAGFDQPTSQNISILDQDVVKVNVNKPISKENESRNSSDKGLSVSNSYNSGISNMIASDDASSAGMESVSKSQGRSVLQRWYKGFKEASYASGQGDKKLLSLGLAVFYVSDARGRDLIGDSTGLYDMSYGHGLSNLGDGLIPSTLYFLMRFLSQLLITLLIFCLSGECTDDLSGRLRSNGGISNSSSRVALSAAGTSLGLMWTFLFVHLFVSMYFHTYQPRPGKKNDKRKALPYFSSARLWLCKLCHRSEESEKKGGGEEASDEAGKGSCIVNQWTKHKDSNDGFLINPAHITQDDKHIELGI